MEVLCSKHQNPYVWMNVGISTKNGHADRLYTPHTKIVSIQFDEETKAKGGSLKHYGIAIEQ